MQRWHSAAMAAVLMVGGTQQLRAQEVESEVPTLAGKWQLDRSRSDRPSRMDRGGLPGGFGGSRRPGGGRPGSGRPGSFPSGGGRGPAEGESPVIRQLLRPSETMEIVLSDSTVSLVDGAGFKRVLRTDGRETVDTLFSGEVRRTKVKRKGDEFGLDQTIDGDTKIREKFRLDGQLGDLVYDLRVESKRMPIPVEIRRLYLKVKN